MQRGDYLLSLFGKHGKPNVVTPQIQRSVALCSFKAEVAVGPNQMLGQGLGVSAPDPSMASRQVAQAWRDKLVEQVNKDCA